MDQPENACDARAAQQFDIALSQSANEAESLMKQSLDKRNFVVGEVYCKYTTKLLQTMPSDRFRKEVVSKFKSRFAAPTQLPGHHILAQSNTKSYPKRKFESVFGSSDNGPSLLKRRKAQEKRTGASVARADIQDAAASKYLLQYNLGKRRK